MSSTFRKLWNIFTSIIVALVVILALLLAGPRLFGMKTFTVLSGSMEPTYHTGSIIYVKKIPDTTKIEDGTVITFMLSEDTIATHRVVGAVPDEDEPGVVRYRTKGDANDYEDGTLVHYKNIIGTPVFTIPKLGYVASYIQNPPGLYLSISFGAMLVLMMFLPELIGALKEDDSKAKEPKPVKEPKPKPEKKAKAKPEKPARVQKRPAPVYEEPELEEPQYVAPAPVYEPEPVELYEAPVVEEPVVRRGSHELKEPSRRTSSSRPAKRKGGAHVIEKPRKR